MLKIKGVIFFGILAVSIIAPVEAAIEVYQFSDKQKTARFKQLTEDLRCPKCQNQNIADSNAEIARDLRTKLQQMLEQDKSDEDIVQYMVERYGDFVLYQPRVSAQTYLLWFGPALLLLMAFGIVFLIVRMRSQRAENTSNSQLNSDQQQQLDSLLNNQKEQ